MTLTYKWSIEEWHDLVNSGVLAGKRVELLESEIIVRWSLPTAFGRLGESLACWRIRFAD